MTEQFQLFKCNVCGNIVEVVHPGSCSLSCCSLPMEYIKEQSEEENLAEKHVPVVTIEGENKTVRVGTIPHPMEKEHYIVFIETISSDRKYLKRKYLYPGDKPEAEFKNSLECSKFKARELCNIHGLWINEINE